MSTPPCAFAARPSAHARNETNGAVPCCCCSSSGKRGCRRWSKLERGGKSLDAVMMRRSRWIVIICRVLCLDKSPSFPDFTCKWICVPYCLGWGSLGPAQWVFQRSNMQQNKNQRWFEGTAIGRNHRSCIFRAAYGSKFDFLLDCISWLSHLWKNVQADVVSYNAAISACEKAGWLHLFLDEIGWKLGFSAGK